MRKFIIREDEAESIRKSLQGNKEALHALDSSLGTLSPYMPSHLDLGNAECCGIFMGIAKDDGVICNECKMSINRAIELLKKMEDCPVCHGKGSTTDHHDPCSECGGFGKIG